MIVIGLTGGIASGKSLVSDYFVELGAPLVDADLLAREVVLPGTQGLAQLCEYFSESILTPEGSLDRAALRELVFANPEDRAYLDATLHPLIRALADDRIEHARQQCHPYLIYAVPLLLETKQQNRFDRIIVVDAPEQLQLQRLLQRDQGKAATAIAIIDAQAKREERLRIADDVIVNSSTMEETRKRVRELHEQYLAIADAIGKNCHEAGPKGAG